MNVKVAQTLQPPEVGENNAPLQAGTPALREFAEIITTDFRLSDLRLVTFLPTTQQPTPRQIHLPEFPIQHVIFASSLHWAETGPYLQNFREQTIVWLRKSVLCRR